MKLSGCLATALLGSATLAGCTSPFAQRVTFDRKIADAPGTITLARPRIYSREDLINERSRDVAWIDRLITEGEDPTKISFKPELYRELEQISAFALAVGVKFDPASALSYRRNAETGDVQQQIDVLKVQLQLDQLRRDAELVRAGFAAQTAPVNSGLGTLGDGSTATTTPVSASAADQLKAAIDRLLTAVAGRLDAEGKPVAQTIATSSPFDDFRDRSSLRDAYKSARNAASLDQLHDAGNARLMRLNFEATVVPVEKYLRSLGAVQVKIIPPTSGSPTAQFLSNWLEFVNSDPSFQSSAALLAGGKFKQVTIGSVSLLLPVVIDASGTEWEPEDMLRRSLFQDSEADDQSRFGSTLSRLSSVDPAHRQTVIGAICLGTNEPASDAAERALLLSRDRELLRDYYLLADKIARDPRSPRQSPLTDEVRAKFGRAKDYRAQLLDIMARDGRCGDYLAQFGAMPEWKAFRDTGTIGATMARVYQVGPREQVQQISTVARSANSFALAASIAGSAPGSGVAADAAASYSRQAMGRASALERAPLVVGYAVGGEESFGWVVGPKVVLDPRGRIEMEQIAKTYDVWVDLSVPGWWAGFELEVASVWAPSPNGIASGRLVAREGSPPRRIPVEIARTLADYDALTNYILGNQERRVNINEVRGGPVNACTDTTLWVRGDNLWRAGSVFVLGRHLKRDAITITPDMRGILVAVPPIISPPNVNLDRTLTVMTPLGAGTWASPVEYLAEPTGEACRAPKPQAAAAADAVSIGEITPALEFAVPSQFTIRVNGANLKKIARVELHGQPGVLQIAADGKSMSIVFDQNSTSSVMSSDNTALDFYDSDKKVVATRRVRTHRAN